MTALRQFHGCVSNAFNLVFLAVGACSFVRGFRAIVSLQASPQRVAVVRSQPREPTLPRSDSSASDFPESKSSKNVMHRVHLRGCI